MELLNIEKMTPFDKHISSTQLQMLKLMIPYTPRANQRMLALSIKFMEMQQTMEFFQDSNDSVRSQNFEKTFSSPIDMVEEFRPYLSDSLKDSVDSIFNLINMMEMASAMEQMNSEGDGHSGTSGFNPMDMMKGMLTPDQQNMFEMYSTMFNETEDLNMKGEQENG